MRRSIGPTVAWRMSLAGDRELALVALVALAVAVGDGDAGGEDGGERGEREHERLAGLGHPQAAGPRADRLRARAERDQRDARDQQPQRGAGLTLGHAWWMSLRTGSVALPPSSTATPKAAVKTPAVLRAIRSSPAQPVGPGRFRSSTSRHRPRADAPDTTVVRQTSRSSCAATSGATTHRCVPAPSSSPARWVRRGRMSIRQQNESAPWGAVRIHRFSGGEAPSRRRRRSSASCSSAGAGGPVVLVAGAAAARDEHELERQPRGVGGEQHRVVVDRDDAVAHAHLLLQQVGEQVAAHRARRVGGEALALARHGGGDERQRVELRVRARERGAALAALVDQQVHEGGVGVGAHAVRHAIGGGRHLLGR